VNTKSSVALNKKMKKMSAFKFTDEELEQELGSWQIKPLTDGFASSYKTLYKTSFTTIAAKAFLIPNKETGEIHHFDLSIRIFKRNRKSEPWEEQIDKSENPFGYHRQLDIKAGNGKTVRELTNFLLAQYELIGTKINSSKVVIDKPTDLDIQELISKMSLGQIEDFGQGIRIQTLKEYKQFLIDNLDKNESFIQSWLDEENGKYRKQRCLIFGIEFIDHKREGELDRKRFDILTRASLSSNEYVIIELKSPKNDVFKIVGFDRSCGNFKQRLLDLGIAKGQIGQIINKSFFGPIEVDIEGRKLALGRGMSKKIYVKKFECPVL